MSLDSALGTHVYEPVPRWVLLAAEQQRKVPEIATIVRESEVTVQRWLKRYLAEGVEGLEDAPRPGRTATVTPLYRTELLAAVRRRPRSLDLPYSLWTLQRLVDYLAEKTGVRVSDETVRQESKKGWHCAESPTAQDQQS